MTFPFTIFVAQQVATKSAAVLGFPGSCHLETAFHTFMCLLLGHSPVLALESEHMCSFRRGRVAHYTVV